MSALTDPLKIADWLIARAGSMPGADVYKGTIINAKGLLLTPGASGGDAVKLSTTMKTQGEAVRHGLPVVAELEVKAATPAAVAAAAPAAPAAPAAVVANPGAAGKEDAAAAAALGAVAANPSSALALAKGAMAPAAVEAPVAVEAPAPVEPAAAPVEPAAAPVEPAAPPGGEAPGADAVAADGATAPQSGVASEAENQLGGRSRKTRHRTPKRHRSAKSKGGKRLSKKKTNKRK
jgi:hypothetical protein